MDVVVGYGLGVDFFGEVDFVVYWYVVDLVV